jgi:hypothetical protein
MKQKNLKNSTEKAFEVVEAFKLNAEALQKTEQDKAFVKTLDNSVRKTDKLEKELLALKEKIKIKKVDLDQQKELISEYIRTARKTLKTELGDKPKLLKKPKPAKKQKKEKPEIVEATK